MRVTRERAYAEAIEIAGAHQSSYGREAAGVFAAAVACAMSTTSTVATVITTCLEVARDGTRDAIQAVCSRARRAFRPNRRSGRNTFGRVTLRRGAGPTPQEPEPGGTTAEPYSFHRRAPSGPRNAGGSGR